MKMISTLQPLIFLVIIETLLVTVTGQTNLALKGIAEQMTTLTDKDGIHSADLAIKGPVNNNWADGCSSTQPGKARAWWALILPEVAYITNVVIYYRGDKPDQMNEFRLLVLNTSLHKPDEILCYTDLNIAGYPNTTQDISCNKLALKVFFFNRHKVVELCYVEVHGCFKGTWGKNCTDSCPSNCIGQHCYPENGFCAWGCDHLNCVNNKCDTNTGVCIHGCVAGRAGQYCNKYNIASSATASQNPPNPSNPARLSIDGNRTNNMCAVTSGPNSYLQIDTGSLSVITTVYLTFGDTPLLTQGDTVVYCSNSSNSWVDGIVLYKGERPTRDINVLTVCRYVIYVPPKANGVSTVDVCEFEIGGCPLLRYGVNCEQYCHCRGPCDLITGLCTLGCLDGWTGERCDKACSGGLFGSECRRTCSENCLKAPCNHVSGECYGGCNKGWEEYNCTKECEVGHFGWNCSQSCFGCISNMCDKTEGFCNNFSGCKPGYVKGPYCTQECDDWYFGTNCESRCNCLNKPCNKFNGACSAEGCAKGWQGSSCDKECDDGSYSFNCEEKCATCFNVSCEILEGNCTYGCIENYDGVQCQTLVSGKLDKSEDNPGAAIGGGIGAVVVIIIVVAMLIIIYRHRSKPKSERYLSNHDEIRRSHENTYCNHENPLKTEDVYINVKGVQESENAKLPLSGKKESKKTVIDVTDEYPEEYDEEEEGNVYNNEPSEPNFTKYKIPVADMKKVINEKKKQDGFKNEYGILPKGLVHAHAEGSKEENKAKNRFLTTWPYDHSRVVLTGDSKHNYINASYIDSYEKEKAYIASQGPKKNTIRDFWQMVWQEKVGKIVMVTKLEEERRKKCEQYWPKTVNKATMVDNYRLTMTEEIYHTIYVYRLIILHNKTNQQERKVHHFHFTQWPDHGVPDDIKLVNFYRKVKGVKCEKIGPMVVHCSAGVGRTGTFIAVDALYQYGKKVGYVDIMEYVQMMRKDRMNMIQTHEQYAIVFDALLELFSVPDTSIQKNDFCEFIQKQENKTKNQTIYREEFQRLRTLRPSYTSNKFTAANSKENKSKNYTTTVLAHDKYRPYLMSYGKTRSDYINAVIIPGYAVDSKMFVTQCPLVETVIDFWTMMYDHDSRIIVLLEPGNKGAPLWLEKKEMLQFDDFRIIKETENAHEEFQLTLNHTKNKEQISINVFTADDWTISNAPPSPDYMLELLQRVQNCWETQKVPITVVCSDGCSKSGLFIALRLVLEKMQMDEEIDIFQVVREIQTRRPEFLAEFDQYEYCYKCIKELLDRDSRDSLYANI